MDQKEKQFRQRISRWCVEVAKQYGCGDMGDALEQAYRGDEVAVEAVIKTAWSNYEKLAKTEVEHINIGPRLKPVALQALVTAYAAQSLSLRFAHGAASNICDYVLVLAHRNGDWREAKLDLYLMANERGIQNAWCFAGIR